MYFHGIAGTISKTIYVNSEQSPKPYGDISLEQSRIDIAFNGKPRTSKYIFNYEGWSICILNGKNTNNLGVQKIKSSEDGMLFVTNIERTLIDIAVRPIYSGGVEEVQMAYQKAKGKISIKKLVTMLKKIGYVYPYHQVIGFFFIGIYGGFIQVGVGFIIIAALTMITGLNLVETNSHKVFIVGIYTIFALIVFAFNGKICWAMGLCLAAGMGLGGWMGSHWAVAGGERWIRWALTICVIAMVIKLFV